ncbi:hypothetical protein Scep_006413 [Stephania cephalantha]|uniref:Uncharacterized protein n=1 Tax=Stephania cephalantha TaxID=152367 RepID=A0AAP0PNZ9_9MAGN
MKKDKTRERRNERRKKGERKIERETERERPSLKQGELLIFVVDSVVVVLSNLLLSAWCVVAMEAEPPWPTPRRTGEMARVSPLPSKPIGDWKPTQRLKKKKKKKKKKKSEPSTSALCEEDGIGSGRPEPM